MTKQDIEKYINNSQYKWEYHKVSSLDLNFEWWETEFQYENIRIMYDNESVEVSFDEINGFGSQVIKNIKNIEMLNKVIKLYFLCKEQEVNFYIIDDENVLYSCSKSIGSEEAQKRFDKIRNEVNCIKDDIFDLKYMTKEDVERFCRGEI